MDALSDANVREGTLNIVQVNKHSLEGEFYSDKSKAGIQFHSEGTPTSNFLTVKSARGENIFSTAKLDDDITFTAVMGGRYLILGDYKIGKTNSTVYRMLKARGQSVLKSLVKHRLSVKLLLKAGYLDSRDVDKTSMMDFRDLLGSKEAGLIHQTALELGRRGLYGVDSTGCMMFYMLAMRIASHVTSKERPAAASFRHRPACKVDPVTTLRNNIVAAHQGLSFCTNNMQYCKTCPHGGQCSGGCGTGCKDCWEMVCGDCCFHRGCLGYNACSNCRWNQLSFKCFNVFDFQCDATYSC
jgi:hypothetical protein